MIFFLWRIRICIKFLNMTKNAIFEIWSFLKILLWIKSEIQKLVKTKRFPNRFDEKNRFFFFEIWREKKERFFGDFYYVEFGFQFCRKKSNFWNLTGSIQFLKFDGKIQNNTQSDLTEKWILRNLTVNNL